MSRHPRAGASLLPLMVGILLAAEALSAAKGRPPKSVRVPAPLAVWLRAIDATPTAAELLRSHAKAALWLERVGRDAHSPLILRHRAIALLAILPGQAARRRLRRLLTSRQSAIRATVAVAWASGPGRRRPARAAATMARALADKDPVVRTAAARAIVLFGDVALARNLAGQRRATERHEGVLAALDASIRRLSRKPHRRPRSSSAK